MENTRNGKDARLLAEELGRNIKAERVRRGMTQAQLAEQSDVVEQTLGRWERGSSFPAVPVLCRLADALAVPVDVLLGRGAPIYISAVPPLSGADCVLVPATRGGESTR